MKRYRKSVFVVIFRKQKNKIAYLVLKRKLHWKGWEFPKGGIEKGESLIQTVKRELKEETGQSPLSIIKFNIRGYYRYPEFLKDRPNYIGQTYQLFAAEVKRKKIKLDKLEHKGYQWLPFKQALKILDFPEKKKCLTIVNKFLTSLK
jgi:bis(5'-nucleosidyl)-tetraphosphatase